MTFPVSATVSPLVLNNYFITTMYYEELMPNIKKMGGYGPFSVISLTTPAAMVVPISLIANLPISGKSL